MSQQFEDITIYLIPLANQLVDERIIEFDLGHYVNTASFAYLGVASQEEGVFNYIKPADGNPGALKVSIRTKALTDNLTDDVWFQINLKSNSNGEAFQKIILSNTEIVFKPAEIVIEADCKCQLPEYVVIDVRKYNKDLTLSLDSVTGGSSEAGTITLIDLTGNDYNDDFNNDFGAVGYKLIKYEFNTATDFWKTIGNFDRFQYNLDLNGDTLSAFITIKTKTATALT